MSVIKLCVVATVASLAIGASTAHAHARLESSEPKAGSTLASAPKEIRLAFSDKLEPAFSKIRLVDANNKEIKLPRTEAGKPSPSTLSVPLPVLPPGQYRVRWSTMTNDGHKIKGEYTFGIR